MKKAGLIIPILLLISSFVLFGMLVVPSTDAATEKMKDHDKTYVIYGEKSVYLHIVNEDERISGDVKKYIIDRASECTDKNIQFGIMYADSFKVSYDYKPYPYFYVMAEKIGLSEFKLISVEGAAMRLDLYPTEKVMAGKLRYFIKDDEIHWRAEGTFYPEGNMQLVKKSHHETAGYLEYEVSDASGFGKYAEGKGKLGFTVQ